MTPLRRYRKSIELHPRLDGLENGLRAEGFIRLALDATLPPPESSLAAAYGNADHHRKNQPGERFGGGARQPVREDPVILGI